VKKSTINSVRLRNISTNIQTFYKNCI